jgi:hypothetical protein
VPLLGERGGELWGVFRAECFDGVLIIMLFPIESVLISSFLRFVSL